MWFDEYKSYTMANINRKVIIMTKLEQLKFDYLAAKGEKEAYQSDEKCARKKVLEWDKRMKEIEKEIKQAEESESDKKLKESILFIKDYCRKAKCDECQFNAPYNVCNLAKPPIDW